MMSVWFNGNFIEETLPLSPSDRGLLLGDGIFETIAVFNGQAIWWQAHLERFKRAADYFDLCYGDDAYIESAVSSVLAQYSGMHGIMRLTLTRGAGQRGLLITPQATPSLMVSFTSWKSGFLGVPARVIIAKTCRNAGSAASQYKTLSYMDNILAAREASAARADEAIMCNNHNHIACATVGNIFIVDDNLCVTPPVTDGVLNGITRDVILRTAQKLGLKTKIASITLEQFNNAREIFIANSLRLVRPVCAMHDVNFTENPVAKQIFDALCVGISANCGIDPREVDRR